MLHGCFTSSTVSTTSGQTRLHRPSMAPLACTTACGAAGARSAHLRRNVLRGMRASDGLLVPRLRQNVRTRRAVSLLACFTNCRASLRCAHFAALPARCRLLCEAAWLRHSLRAAARRMQPRTGCRSGRPQARAGEGNGAALGCQRRAAHGFAYVVAAQSEWADGRGLGSVGLLSILVLLRGWDRCDVRCKRRRA